MKKLRICLNKHINYLRIKSRIWGVQVYTFERYCNPASNGTDELDLDWYMPCIKEKNQI
jgi:hypothetical protein